LAGILFQDRKNKKEKMANIILLNGASSSGKTSLARALQQRWQRPLLLLGIDDVISMMPFKYTGEGEQAKSGFHITAPPGPPQFVPGKWAYQLNELAAKYVADIARSEFDLVLDYVFNEQLLQAFVTQLSEQKVLFVGVFCAVEQLESRERERGDRTIGLAREQLKSVHCCRQHYHMEVDSSEASVDAMADEIVARVNSGPLTTGLFPVELCSAATSATG